MRYIIMVVVMLMLILSGCVAIGREVKQDTGYRYLDMIAEEPFEQVGDWRTYDDGQSLYMNVEDGVYRIHLAKRQFVWTQSPIEHEDVVIEVEVTQTSEYDHNAFGVMCRANPDNSGRGYYFLISGDGYYTIRWGNGRTLDEIVPAKPSNVIKQGQTSNHIRAVCVGDYLGLWVNDKLVAQARDTKSSQGVVGLVGVMNYDGRTLDVEFDDLKVWEAERWDGK